MIFLTEEDVRQRCELGQRGEFRLQAGERLTPAATELLRSRNCRVILPGQAFAGLKAEFASLAQLEIGRAHV